MVKSTGRVLITNPLDKGVYEATPRHLHEARRLAELEKAIGSRLSCGEVIPAELVFEYNELIDKKNQNELPK